MMKHQDLAKTIVNDPKLLAAIKIRSLGGFCVCGTEVPTGSVVEVPLHVARDLHAQGKCELI